MHGQDALEQLPLAATRAALLPDRGGPVARWGSWGFASGATVPGSVDDVRRRVLDAVIANLPAPDGAGERGA